jgi:hypothetical protein
MDESSSPLPELLLEADEKKGTSTSGSESSGSGSTDSGSSGSGSGSNSQSTSDAEGEDYELDGERGSPNLSLIPLPPPAESKSIRNVWKANLYEEFAKIRSLLKTYNYVAMDTEFPGVVAKPLGLFVTQAEYMYQSLRVNVNMLKLIQLGLTFMDKDGNMPEGTNTWQFNFYFDME